MAYTKDELIAGVKRAANEGKPEVANEIAAVLKEKFPEVFQLAETTEIEQEYNWRKDIPGWAEGEEYYAALEAEKKATPKASAIDEFKAGVAAGQPAYENWSTAIEALVPDIAYGIRFEHIPSEKKENIGSGQMGRKGGAGSLVPIITSPEERYGVEFTNKTLNFNQRIGLINQKKQDQYLSEYQDVLLSQDVHGRNDISSVTGQLLGSLSPEDAFLFARTLKGTMMAGSIIGGETNTAQQIVDGRVDPIELTTYMAGGSVLAGGGKVLPETIKNASSYITNKLRQRKDFKNVVEESDNLVDVMEETAAKAVVEGVPREQIVTAVKNKLNLNEEDVLEAAKYANKNFTIPNEQEAQKIVAALDNPVLTRQSSISAFDEFVQPISTGLGKISKKMMVRMRNMDRRIAETTRNDLKTVETFFNEASRLARAGAKNPNFQEFELALFNQDYRAAQDIADEFFPKLSNELPKVRELLDKRFQELKDAGVPIEYLGSYFPRSVKDLEGLQESLDLPIGLINAELSKVASKLDIDVKKLPRDIKEKTINRVIEGNLTLGKGKAGYAKGRKITELTIDNMGFYNNVSDSLYMYLTRTAREVERRKFFGKSVTSDETGETLVNMDSIGKLVADELPDLSPSQSSDVVSLLRSRFQGEDVAMSRLGAGARDLQYMSLLAQPSSAAIQLGDVGSAAYLNGVRNVFASLVNKKDLAETMGVLNNVSAEMSGAAGFTKALDKTLQLSGFKAVDAFGKDVLLNSSLRKYTKLAENKPSEIRRKWAEVFEGDTQQLIDDLAAGEITENVKLLLWNDLAEIQPISLSEMPMKYLKAADARLFYSFKTYFLKQLDRVRQDSFKKIATGNPKQIKEGVGNLARYALIIGSANGAVQTVRDFVLTKGQADLSDFPDAVAEGLMSLVFANKWNRERYLSEGKYGELLYETAKPPIVGVVDRPVVSLYNYIQGQTDVEDVVATTFSQLPLGKTIYDLFLGGAEKKAEKLRKEEAKERLKGF